MLRRFEIHLDNATIAEGVEWSDRMTIVRWKTEDDQYTTTFSNGLSVGMATHLSPMDQHFAKVVWLDSEEAG